jgi:hypothetical protein
MCAQRCEKHAGPCEVTRQPLDVFVCSGTLQNGKLTAKPKSFGIQASRQMDSACQDLGQPSDKANVAMKTLDIFAGALVADVL